MDVSITPQIYNAYQQQRDYIDDQGVMSAILVNQRWLELFQYPDATMKGFIVAIFELGALSTSIIAGWVIDSLGRVAAIRIGGAVFIVGGILQTASNNTVMLLLGRLIAGFGVGFFSTVIPMYVAELGRTANVSHSLINPRLGDNWVSFTAWKSLSIQHQHHSYRLGIIRFAMSIRNHDCYRFTAGYNAIIV